MQRRLSCFGAFIALSLVLIATIKPASAQVPQQAGEYVTQAFFVALNGNFEWPQTEVRFRLARTVDADGNTPKRCLFEPIALREGRPNPLASGLIDIPDGDWREFLWRGMLYRVFVVGATVSQSYSHCQIRLIRRVMGGATFNAPAPSNP